MKIDNKPIIPTDLVDLSQITSFINSVSNTPVSEEEQKKIVSLIDLTSLEGKDTPSSIKILCEKAMLLHTASVCVYPTLVMEAKKYLKSSSVKCASVAGGFPHGQTATKIKLSEVKYAVEEGADEIDFVISRNLLLQNEFNKVHDEISGAKEICGKNITLKTILETGELPNVDVVFKASEIAIQAGSDFIKTSTGKISVNATLESVGIMLIAIKKHYDKTGNKIGIKPSGGISDTNTAVKYIRLTKTILDESWINPKLFRFGASRLADSISNTNNTTSSY